MNGGKNGAYGDPVQVRARADGRPCRFVWRSRLYLVRAICEHWVINREWWREPAARAHGDPLRPELEFWRVEVSLGQGILPGVYELRQEIGTGAWMLRHP
jgi:hypothetical protein